MNRDRSIPVYPRAGEDRADYIPEHLTEEEMALLVPATDGLKQALCAATLAQIQGQIGPLKDPDEENLNLVRHFSEYIQFELWHFADVLTGLIKSRLK